MTEKEQIKSFEEYKLIHNFYYSNEPLKSWLNETNFINHFEMDWNNLMPVIEKIEKLFDDGIDITLFSDGVLIENWRKEKEIIRMTNGEQHYTRKEFAYKSVIRFIKWYNKQRIAIDIPEPSPDQRSIISGT